MSQSHFESLEPRGYLSAGTPDPTFGTNGVVNFVYPNNVGFNAEAVVAEPDGKIIVGTTGSIIRFNHDGSLDTAFGTNGLVNAPANSAFSAIALQPGGKLVVEELHLGSSPSFQLDRFDLNRNGAADTTFLGTNVLTNAGFEASVVGSDVMTVQRDGKILFGGIVGTLQRSAGAVLRLNANGAVDTTFGTSGIAIGPSPATDFTSILTSGIAVRSDGTIALDGIIEGTAFTPYLITLNSKGKPTTVRTPKPRKSNFQPPTTSVYFGKIVARTDGMFVNIAESGQVNDPFGGIATPPTRYVSFQGQATPSAVLSSAITAAPGNQVVVVGMSPTVGSSWQLERFLSNQQPDGSFGAGGIATVNVDPNTGLNISKGITSDSDGNLIAVGNSPTELSIARIIDSSAAVRDRTAPVASLIDASSLSSPAPLEEFTVEYTDNVAVKASSVRRSNIVVKGPKAFGTRKTILIGTSGGNGSPLFATYAIAGIHAGLWTAADNGAYTLVLQSHQVTDTRGNAAPSTVLGSFNVNIAAM